MTEPTAKRRPANDERPVVMHVLHTLARAGTEVLVRDMVRGMSDGFRFVVAALDGRGPLGRELRAMGVPVHVLGRRPGFDGRCVGRLRRLMRRHRVGVVHAHQYTPWFYSALARWGAGGSAKLIFTEHRRHWPDRRRWKRLIANRVLGRMTDRVTAVGEYSRRALIDYEGFGADRVEVIHNGIDCDALAKGDPDAGRRVRGELGIDEAEPVILQVGSLRAVKDHATAIDALRGLHDRGCGAWLLLAGDGPLRDELETRAQEQGVAEHVRFLGDRGDVAALWQAADVGLCTSVSEGISVALLEAMAAGKAVVATDVGGNPEIVIGDQTGYLAGRGDVNGITDALYDLLGSVELRAGFGAAGRERAKAHFDEAKMHRLYSAVYEQLTRGGCMMRDTEPLVVFADDWGRHPSGPQHLVQTLLPDRQVLWVNTIGTRRLALNRHNVRRGIEKLRQWLTPRERGDDGAAGNLTVINPVMWPSYAGRAARTLNARLVARAVRRHVREHFDREPVVLTTIPMTADLIGRFDARRWVYYCVDDWSSWPGLDHETLGAAERRLVDGADAVVAASDRLAEHLVELGGDPTVVTHGVDAAAWSEVDSAVEHPVLDQIEALPGPRAVFWGMVDTKISVEAVSGLAERFEGSIVLVGPRSDGAEELEKIGGVHMFDAVPAEVLPRVAALSDVLVMPYVTDHAALVASQPLKLKEYLATDRAVVCTDLPATRAWWDCADVVGVERFADVVVERAWTGATATQLERRRERLAGETWETKSKQLAAVMDDRPTASAPVVLHVRTVCGTGGGPDKTIVRSARHVDGEAYRVAGAYIHPKGDAGIENIEHNAEREGLELFTIGERGPLDPRTVLRLGRLADELNVGVWHGHDYKSDLIGLLLRRRRQMKVVTTVHGWTDESLRMRVYRWAHERFLRRMDHVIAVSPAIAERCRAVGVAEDRLSVIGNAIEPEEYARVTSIEDAKVAARLPVGSPVIGVVGRLSVEKGVDRLIEALPELMRTAADLRVLVVGDGPQWGAIEAAARERGVRHAIRFVGWREPIQPWLEAMDLLVLPSRTEGMPNVVLEAMAMGVAVAATDVGGVGELIEYDSTGVLLGEDAQEWAEALTALLSDAEKRRELAEAARARVVERFTFAQRTQKVLEVYDMVIGSAVEATPIEDSNDHEDSMTPLRQAA